MNKLKDRMHEISNGCIELLLIEKDFQTTAKKIFTYCKELTGATAGYVALLNTVGDENQVLFLDAGGRECFVDKDLPMPIRGLREVAYREKRVVYDNNFSQSVWMKFMPSGHVDLKNVLFAPLIIGEQALGLLGLSNKEGNFTNDDVEMVEYLSKFIVSALRNSYVYQNLLEKEDLLNQMGDIAKIGGWEMDLLTRKAKWTKGTYDIMEIGYTEQIPGPDEHIEYYLPQYREMIIEAMDNLINKDIALDFIAEATTARGKRKWFRALGKSMEYIDGKCVRIAGTFQDITESIIKEKENENLQKQLLQASRLASIGELAAGVGHEINNPLTIMSGHTELLEKKLKKMNLSELDLTKTILSQKQSIERISKIVKALMTYSKTDNNSDGVLNLNDTIENTLSLIGIIYEQDNIIIEKQFYPGDLFIKGDHGKIKQVITNLLSNAKDATINNQERKIILETNVDANRVVLKITDNGPGIESVVLDKIFDTFFTTKEVGKGAGLGLGIVKNIVENSNGTIEVKSKPGEGASVIVSWPQELNGVLDFSNDVEKTEPLQKKDKALVIDDEEEIRQLMVIQLCECGLIVDEACNGQDGLDKINNNFYDYIFADIKMPQMSGDKLINILSKRKKDFGKIFVMTGVVDEYVEKLPVDGIIHKPFDFDELCDLIKETDKE